MSSIFSRETLTLSKPSLRGIFYFFLSVLLVIIAAEIVARSPIGSLLPAPSVQADSFLFDAKVYNLERQVQQNGKIDCLFIGSSVSNSDIDPDLVEQIYFAQTGETIHCYNLGYPAMTVENAAVFINAAIAHFSPRVVFYTFIPRDLTDEKYNVDFLEKSPWFQTGETQPSDTQWLVNHSYAYRYYLTWRYLLVDKNRAKRIDEIKKLTSKGFQPTEDIREPYPEKINMMPGYVSQVWATPRPQQLLANLIAIQSQEVRIILVEGPIYRDPQYYSVWDAYERAYIPPLEQFAQEKDVPFWRTEEISAQIPQPHWYDWVHVNRAGAAAFSQWLGEMMAENAWLFE
jgi:hypothetical protein